MFCIISQSSAKDSFESCEALTSHLLLFIKGGRGIAE